MSRTTTIGVGVGIEGDSMDDLVYKLFRSIVSFF